MAATLAQLRAHFGDPSLTDAQLIQKTADKFGIDATEIANEVGYDGGTKAGKTAERFDSAFANYRSGLQGVGAEVAKRAGLPDVGGYLDRKRQDNEFQAGVADQRAAAKGAISRWGDDPTTGTGGVHGVADAADYVAGMAIQSSPYLLESMAGGMVGRGLSTGARATLAADRAAGATSQAGVAAAKTLDRASVAGSMVASYPSAVGDIIGNQHAQIDANGGQGETNLLAAAAGGLPYAALNAFEPAHLAAARLKGVRAPGFLDGMKGVKGAAARTATSAGIAGVTEGVNEVGQEVINQYAGRMAVDPNATLTSGDAVDRYKESFAGGAALGGLVGGAAGGWRRSNGAHTVSVDNAPGTSTDVLQGTAAADPTGTATAQQGIPQDPTGAQTFQGGARGMGVPGTPLPSTASWAVQPGQPAAAAGAAPGAPAPGAAVPQPAAAAPQPAPIDPAQQAEIEAAAKRKADITAAAAAWKDKVDTAQSELVEIDPNTNKPYLQLKPQDVTLHYDITQLAKDGKIPPEVEASFLGTMKQALQGNDTKAVNVIRKAVEEVKNPKPVAASAKPATPATKETSNAKSPTSAPAQAAPQAVAQPVATAVAPAADPAAVGTVPADTPPAAVGVRPAVAAPTAPAVTAETKEATAAKAAEAPVIDVKAEAPDVVVGKPAEGVAVVENVKRKPGLPTPEERAAEKAKRAAAAPAGEAPKAKVTLKPKAAAPVAAPAPVAAAPVAAPSPVAAAPVAVTPAPSPVTPEPVAPAPVAVTPTPAPVTPAPAAAPAGKYAGRPVSIEVPNPAKGGKPIRRAFPDAQAKLDSPGTPAATKAQILAQLKKEDAAKALPAPVTEHTDKPKFDTIEALATALGEEHGMQRQAALYNDYQNGGSLASLATKHGVAKGTAGEWLKGRGERAASGKNKARPAVSGFTALVDAAKAERLEAGVDHGESRGVVESTNAEGESEYHEDGAAPDQLRDEEGNDVAVEAGPIKEEITRTGDVADEDNIGQGQEIENGENDVTLAQTYGIGGGKVSADRNISPSRHDVLEKAWSALNDASGLADPAEWYDLGSARQDGFNEAFTAETRMRNEAEAARTAARGSKAKVLPPKFNDAASAARLAAAHAAISEASDLKEAVKKDIGRVNDTPLPIAMNRANLSKAELSALIDRYNVQDKLAFFAALAKDISDYTSGVLKGASEIVTGAISRIATAALSIAIILNSAFNPHFASDAKAATLRSPVNISETQTLHFRNATNANTGPFLVSSDARTVMNYVATNSGSDTVSLVLDGPQATLFVMKGKNVVGASPMLYGAKGIGTLPGGSMEAAEKSTLPLAEKKITPKGIFPLVLDKDPDYGTSLTFAESESGDYRLAVHRVYLGDPTERRAQRLASPSLVDKAVSYGCVNVSGKFYDTVLAKHDYTGRAYAYIMPTDGTKLDLPALPSITSTTTTTLDSVSVAPGMPGIPGTSMASRPEDALAPQSSRRGSTVRANASDTGRRAGFTSNLGAVLASHPDAADDFIHSAQYQYPAVEDAVRQRVMSGNEELRLSPLSEGNAVSRAVAASITELTASVREGQQFFRNAMDGLTTFALFTAEPFSDMAAADGAFDPENRRLLINVEGSAERAAADPRSQPWQAVLTSTIAHELTHAADSQALASVAGGDAGFISLQRGSTTSLTVNYAPDGKWAGELGDVMDEALGLFMFRYRKAGADVGPVFDALNYPLGDIAETLNDFGRTKDPVARTKLLVARSNDLTHQEEHASVELGPVLMQLRQEFPELLKKHLPQGYAFTSRLIAAQTPRDVAVAHIGEDNVRVHENDRLVRALKRGRGSAGGVRPVSSQVRATRMAAAGGLAGGARPQGGRGAPVGQPGGPAGTAGPGRHASRLSADLPPPILSGHTGVVAWVKALASDKLWRTVPGSLGFLSTEQMADRFKGMPLVKAFSDTMRAMGGLAEKVRVSSDRVSSDWSNLRKTHGADTDNRFSKVLLDATTMQAWPQDDLGAGRNTHLDAKDAELSAAHQKLQGEFNALPPAYQSMFERVVAEKADQRRQEVAGLRQGIVDAYRPQPGEATTLTSADVTLAAGLKKPERAGFLTLHGTSATAARTLGKLWSDLDSHASDFKTLAGPYFPKMRFGDHVVSYKSSVYQQAETALMAATADLQARLADDTYAPIASAEKDLKALTTRLKQSTVPETRAELAVRIEAAKAELELLNEPITAARKLVTTRQTQLTELKAHPTHYGVEFYEHRAQAQANEARLQAHFAANGGTGTQVSRDLKNIYLRSLDGVTPEFMRRIESKLAGSLPSADAGKVRDSMRELYLRLQPDTSALKSQLKRLDVSGVRPEEAQRAFAMSSLRAAHSISRLRYGAELHQHVNNLRFVRGDEDSKLVGNELAQRIVQNMVTNNNPVLSALTSLTHMTYLGLSPSFMVTQLTQPWVISAPVMAGRHGIRETGRQLSKASLHAAALLKASFDKDRRLKFLLDPREGLANGTLTADEAKMLTDMLDSGRIDLTVSHELGAVSAGDDGGMLTRAAQMASYPASQLEVANRVATALAGYRAEKAKTGDHVKAMAYADTLVADTHLNYAAENRARHMHPNSWGGYGRVMFQFRAYQQGMLYLIYKNLADGLRGDKEALRSLAYLAGMQLSTAGLAGMPIPGVLAVAATMLYKGWTDDDDEQDLKETFFQALKSVLGERGATAVTKGLPAAAGIDVSSRVGMGNIADVVPFADDKQKGKKLAGEYFDGAIGGPALGMLENWAEAVHLAGRGEFTKAAAMAVPKAMADPIRAASWMAGGTTDSRGNQVLAPEDISAVDVLIKSVGFTPSAMGRVQAQRGAFFDARQNRNDARAKIIADFAHARLAGDDTAAARRAAAEFNSRHPDNRILPAALEQAVMRQRQAARDMRSGVPVGKRDRSLASDMGVE